jgi:hypothetical protein
VTDAFYTLDGASFVPTPWTRGPWDQNAQHAGPPAALLGRAIERADPDPRWRVARLTVEIFRPVPLAALHIEVRIPRPGRRVQFIEASLGDGPKEVARASAWRIQTAPESVPSAGDEPLSLPDPGASAPQEIFDQSRSPSYFTAMEWRFARGSFFAPGPATAWMRMRHPLVEGEDPSPLTRVLVAADSGNGISSVLDIRTHLFVNVELTAHFTRMPEGEWVGLEAVTRVDPGGVGTAESVLWDTHGRFGAARQSLLVAPR